MPLAAPVMTAVPPLNAKAMYEAPALLRCRRRVPAVSHDDSRNARASCAIGARLPCWTRKRASDAVGLVLRCSP
jgi:hypothetical protein